MNKTKSYVLQVFVLLLLFVVLSPTIKAQTNASLSATISSSGTISYSSPSPTPSSTPTPTPTPTPSPTPSDNNLVPIPSAWNTYETYYPPTSYSVLANVHFDTSVTYEGTKSIRIDPIGNSTNIGRECDSNWMAVSIGETIVFSCWMKTTASGLGDTSPQSGARIGIDFYGADPVTGGYITGIAYAGAYTQTPTSSQEANNYVSWGTSVWTLRTLDFVVPSVVYDPSGHAVAPTGIIPWMQVWSSTYGGSDPGQAWFADPTLYINP